MSSQAVVGFVVSHNLVRAPGTIMPALVLGIVIDIDIHVSRIIYISDHQSWATLVWEEGPTPLFF